MYRPADINLLDLYYKSGFISRFVAESGRKVETGADPQREIILLDSNILRFRI